MIQVKDLVLGYEGKAILGPLNFVVQQGDYFCIVGENGSGKSTLMKTLLNLQSPISGTVVFDDIVNANEIGYLPQQSDVQRDFPASVKEIVLSGCQNQMGWRPFYGRKEKQMADEAMKKMEITPLKDRCYRELSGGQQQRVLLARALCAASKVLLLDEPVAGLDPSVTKQMYDLIRDLNKKDGMTIIMITHDLSASLQDATRVLHVSDEVFCGTKEEYLMRLTGGNHE